MKNLRFIIPIIILAIGCSQTASKTVPLKEAYTDGFEVIVIDNLSINTFALKEAEKIIKSSSSASYLLPKNKIESIEKQIKQHNKPDSNYPFIKIEITEIESEKQIITLSFHQSNSTYYYCYEATPSKVLPLWSSFKNLKKNEKVIYNKDI